MKQKIIHFGYLNSSITKPYIKYLQNNFNIDEHEFFLINQKKENELDELKNIYLSGNTIYSLLKYYLKTRQCPLLQKIFVHYLLLYL